MSVWHCRLAERISAEGRACVIIVNKWDAIEDKVILLSPNLPLSCMIFSYSVFSGDQSVFKVSKPSCYASHQHSGQVPEESTC